MSQNLSGGSRGVFGDTCARGRRRWPGLRVVPRKAALMPGGALGGEPLHWAQERSYGPKPFYLLSTWSLDTGRPSGGPTMEL